MIRLAGIVLVISVICFGIGVTRPVVLDYFSAGSGAAVKVRFRRAKLKEANDV